MRFLVVEDHSDTIESLCTYLTHIGHECVGVKDCAEAVDQAMKQLCDVVVVDFYIPGMDGVETAKRLRALPGYSDIPLVFASAAAGEDMDHIKSEAAALGRSVVLQKPYYPDALVAAAESMVRP